MFFGYLKKKENVNKIKLQMKQQKQIKAISKSLQKLNIKPRSLSNQFQHLSIEISQSSSSPYKKQKEKMDIEDNAEHGSHEPENLHDKHALFLQLTKDIEFVQMLADPNYLRELHKRGYFYQQSFMNYLRGLSQYMFLPQYVKMIKYPQGLWNLKNLLSSGFIECIKDGEKFQKFLEFIKKRNEELRKQHK